MKLPGIDYGGKAESLGAERRLSTARTWSHALEALGDTAIRFADAQDEESFMNERNEYLLEKSKVDLKLRSPYQETKEIPIGVSYEPTEDKWVDGQKTTTTRSQVPTYEVQTQWVDNFHSQADSKAKAKLSRGAYKKWKKWFAEQSLADRTRNGIAQFDAAQAASKARVGETIESLTDAGKYEDAQIALQQSPYHTEAEKIKATDKIANESEMRPIEDAAMRGDLATLQAERDRLLDENYTGVLDSNVRQRTVKYIDGEMNRAEAEADAQVAEANARFYSDANLAIDNREAGPLEIEQWYADGLIKPNQRTALHRSYERTLTEKTTEANYSTRVSAIENGEVYASPADKEDKKAVNWAVDQDPDKAIPLAIKTGILPDQLENAFASQAYNAPVKEAAKLLPAWVAFEDAQVPTLFSGMHSETDDLFTLAAQLHRGGINPNQAIETARENMGMTEEKRKFLLKRYETQLKDGDNDAALRTLMEDDPEYSGGWFGKDLDVATTRMRSDYDPMVQSMYVVSGGNLPLAQQLAYNKVKRSYGKTGVGGGFATDKEGVHTGDPEDADYEAQIMRPMKFPVEKMTGLSTDDAQEVFRTYALDRGYDADNLYYIEDNITARSAKNPSYPVIQYNAETGDWGPLRRPDNTLDRWQPLDWLDQTVNRKREIEMNRAKAEREQVMENRAANEQAREASDVFDEVVPTGPKARQEMQRKFFGD